MILYGFSSAKPILESGKRFKYKKLLDILELLISWVSICVKNCAFPHCHLSPFLTGLTVYLEAKSAVSPALTIDLYNKALTSALVACLSPFNNFTLG
jgi:hypothetical protein